MEFAHYKYHYYYYEFATPSLFNYESNDNETGRVNVLYVQLYLQQQQ